MPVTTPTPKFTTPNNYYVRALPSSNTTEGHGKRLRRAAEREKPTKVSCYQETSSRLFVIDVGNDPERLRQLHPDRSKFIIIPAKVGLHYQRRATGTGQKTEQPILRDTLPKFWSTRLTFLIT
jgi:hypothetical protein